MLTLITGGARSGKSRYALELAEAFAHRAFLATAEAFDEEMRRRIEAHREERSGAFFTVEEPLELARSLGELPPETEVVVVDCLTVWLGNLMYHANPGVLPAGDEARHFRQTRELLERIDAGLPYDLILVGNELGMGLVPAEAESRAFRDLAGRLNQEIARRADRVVLMVSGLPLDVPVPPGGEN